MAEISEAEDIGKSYVSILQLPLLAHDIVETILIGGRMMR